MNLKEDLKNCYTTTGKLSFNKINSQLWSDICEQTSFLDEFNPKPQERIYCVLNDIREILYCPITHKKLRFSPQTKQYQNTATYTSRNRIIKNPADFKQVSQNCKNEIMEKYNNMEYHLLTKDECKNIAEKLLQYDNSRITPIMAKSYIDFVCSVFYYTEFIPIDKFNISERLYCIENNLTQLPTDSNGILLKFQNRKIGYSKFPSKEEMYKFYIDNASKIISEDFIINEFIKDKNSGTTSRMILTCKSCNTTFSTFFKNGLWKNIYCSGCNGLVNRSKMELEMIDYIKSLGITNIMENSRTIIDKGEIDIFLPDYNLGIEMSGILWHSFGSTYPNTQMREKDYKYRHFEKYEKCKNKNITLLTIFDNEWNHKRNIVKSIVSNKLGKTITKIYARKCEFREVSKMEADQFLIENHIQGKCSYSTAYGLYHNQDLVSLMCFGNRTLTRGSSAHELIRFCNKIHTTVIGGASKILKNSKVKNFISYCDLRYGTGNLYEKLGMKLKHISKPNYYYTRDNTTLQHRVNFQKHKIISEPTTKTERELMYERGYRRIYDCGNLVFEYLND